jgi:hypothetical protein
MPGVAAAGRIEKGSYRFRGLPECVVVYFLDV